MRLRFLASLILTHSARAEDPGFSPIFDGKSLEGWRGQDAAFWSVEEGAITGTITAQRPAPMNQYLVWQGGLVEDFELKLDFRLTGSATPDTNSGFQFRSRRLPNGDVGGYQVDINAGTPPKAGLYDEFGRHFMAREGELSVFDANGKKTLEKLALEPGAMGFKLDEWHEYHLSAIGPKQTLRVNGKRIAETTDHDTDSAEARGILALQLHTGPPMKVQFRNVRLKRSPSNATPRDVVIAGAALHWEPGERADAHQPMLKPVGEITPGIVVDGARVARLRNAYFDAALEFNQPKAWNAPGEALTVFLRARVPDGNWTTALFAKRGYHDICNFNLYGYDIADTPGPDIGFEIHTDQGFFSTTFPVSRIDAVAWHDLAARYDGKRLQLLCDGAVMSEKPASGKLTQNQEPVLLGAETEHGKPARFFTGEMAGAALWTRGPWSPAPGTPIDTPILYAAKRMFDGKRHVITGWQRDLGGDRDAGPHQWGGTQSIPREVFEVAPGELGFRPVEAVRAVFSQSAFVVEKGIALGGSVGTSSGARFTVPDHYRLDCRVTLDGAESFTVGFREQAG